MAGKFLGVGWGFSLDPADEAKLGVGLDGAGRTAEASDEESVRQAIWLILSTAPGERLARPDFGCGIHDLVFAPLNAGTLGSILHEVDAALTRWEPRIRVIDVDAYPHDVERNLLVVDIQYEVRSTNSRFNLVYPFYLS